MSQHIRYSDLEHPKFPYLKIGVSNVVNIRYFDEIGKIDTGAGMTVIPEYLIKTLHLEIASDVEAKGAESQVYTPRDTYFMNIKIDSLEFRFVEVTTLGERDDVLIGRDLINLWKMQLNGQKHDGSFDVWSTNTSLVS